MADNYTPWKHLLGAPFNAKLYIDVFRVYQQHVGQPNVRKDANGILQQHLHHPNTPRSMTRSFYFDRAKKLAGVADRLQQENH